MLAKKLKRLLPRSAQNALRLKDESAALAALPKAVCEASNLTAEVPQLAATPEWALLRQQVSFGYKSGGAVNPGDQRAIYALTRSLKPQSVLEIGTHLGGSTVMFALALKDTGATLTTVDILDVNGPAGPYVRHGGSSPLAMIRALGCEAQFVTRPSVEYLSECPQRFDLIFLDGLHDAPNVYEEIPLALRLLNPGGLILLHDVFPQLHPLWDDGIVVPGPWLAVERLRDEGAPLRIVPLGALPWPTKQGSTVTSLAYLLRG